MRVVTSHSVEFSHCGWAINIAGHHDDITINYDVASVQDHLTAITNAMRVWSVNDYDFRNTYFSFYRLHQGIESLPFYLKYLFCLDHSEAIEVLANPLMIQEHIALATDGKTSESELDYDAVLDVTG